VVRALTDIRAYESIDIGLVLATLPAIGYAGLQFL